MLRQSCLRQSSSRRCRHQRRLRSHAHRIGRSIGGERRGGNIAGDCRVHCIARRAERSRKWLEEQHAARSPQETGAARRDGLGIHRFPCRRDPRAHRRPRHRTPRSAQSVRAGRRAPPGRDSNSGDRTVPRPCFCGFGLRRRVAVSQGDAEDTPAPRRASNGDRQRSPAPRCCALRACFRRGSSLRPRQPRPLLGAQLAAASSPDAARLSRRLPHHAYRGGRRRFSARSRRLALPHRSDGYRGRSVLVPTAHRVCRLVCFRLGDRRRAQHSRLFVRGAPARRLRAWPRSPRHSAGIRLAPASRTEPRHRSAVSRDASSRPRRTERATVGRHCAVVGALARGSHARFLAPARRYHLAAGQQRDPAYGGASASAARLAAARRGNA